MVLNSIFIDNFQVDNFQGIGKYFPTVSKVENFDTPKTCWIFKNPSRRYDFQT